MVTHPSPEISQALVDKIVARRGRLHAFDTMDAQRTALVVVDVDAASHGREPASVSAAIRNINAIAAAVRRGGGVVAFVLSEIGDPAGLRAKLGTDLANAYVADSLPGGPGRRLAEGLDVGETDLHAVKQGASAFFPGKCDLHDRLSERNIGSVLIAGLVTNICCESSGRDAAELGYEVTMVSDANVGQGFGLHEASLSTFFRFFGDVRPTRQVIHMLSE